MGRVNVEVDFEWGLDHGTWSVLKKMYPDADIPTTQLSIDYTLSPQEHYEIGRQLQSLRSKGILIVGSGNLVHNLRLARLDLLDHAFDWVSDFDETMVEYLAEGRHQDIVDYSNLGEIARLAHPTTDHFFPLLYTIGASDSTEQVTTFNQFYMAGSLSMTSFKIG
jgi:4,5-DOPA dioxygenase extradiol